MKWLSIAIVTACAAFLVSGCNEDRPSRKSDESLESGHRYDDKDGGMVVFYCSGYGTNEDLSRFEKIISDIERNLGLKDEMEGAIVGNDECGVTKTSKPIKSGKYKGMVRQEHFSTVCETSGCSVDGVFLLIVDPKTGEPLIDPKTGERVEKKNAVHLRLDNSIRAVCDGPVTITDRRDGREKPNLDCDCYDKDSKRRDFGKFGCLDEVQIEMMNEHNANLAK